MPTRVIKRLADSAEIYIRQPGDVVVNRQGVLRRKDGKMLDGLYTDPYGALKLLASGRAVVLEED